MAVAEFLNLLTISCLVIIASLGSAPVLALSVDSTTQQARHDLHPIGAKGKRATSANATLPLPKHTSEGFSSSGSFDSEDTAKVGIAWRFGNIPSIQDFKTVKVDKYYTYSPSCVDFANQVGMNCCPMLWGDQQIGDFVGLVKPGYAQCALGFNEPNSASQSNMTPQHGADLWREFINPLKDQGYFLVSPACSNGPSGKPWIQNFLASCAGCQVDAIALHWAGTNPQDLINYVTDMHLTFNKPIWVTEFSCEDFSGSGICTPSYVIDFMRNVTAFMDGASFVQEYFTAEPIEDENNEPNELGLIYIGEA